MVVIAEIVGAVVDMLLEVDVEKGWTVTGMTCNEGMSDDSELVVVPDMRDVPSTLVGELLVVFVTVLFSLALALAKLAT